MKIIFIISFIGFALAGCATVTKVSVRPDEHMEIGWTPRTVFQSPEYAAWFDSGYAAYQPQKEYVERLRNMKDSVQFIVVYGTWCHDSQREVPRFFKIMDAIEFPQQQITLIAVDRALLIPAGVAKEYNVAHTPAIIVKYRGVELGRIVEQPPTTLEEYFVETLRQLFE